MKPIKVAIYGSCHAAALEAVLASDPQLQRSVEFVPTPAAMVISPDDIARLVSPATGLDLMIYQTISEDFRGPEYASASILQRLPASCRMLSFSYYHLELYTPYLAAPGAEFPAHEQEYVDYLLGSGIARGLCDGEIAEELMHFPGFAPYAPSALSSALAEMRSREDRVLEGDRPIDIRLVHRIAETFRRERLGHTVNHPTRTVFDWLAADVRGRLTEMFGLALAGHASEVDPLMQTRYFAPPFARRAFQMEFSDPPEVALREHRMDLADYIVSQRAYFEAVPRRLLWNRVETLAQSRAWYDALLDTPPAGFGHGPPRYAVPDPPARPAAVRLDQGVVPAELTSGWSQPEAAGLWTDGDEARLTLAVPPDATGDLWIRVTALGYAPPGAMGQSVEVRVNGTALVVWAVRPNTWLAYSVIVPQALLASGEPLDIRLAIPGAACPSGDPRKLGIAVQEIAVESC